MHGGSSVGRTLLYRNSVGRQEIVHDSGSMVDGDDMWRESRGTYEAE